MSSPAPTRGSDSPKLRDDTTRFLCGAAYRDEEFADSAIREYLLETTRSIPRSPGVNAGAVLREAVAARTRRKVRDSVLLVPAVVVLFAASGLLLGPWLLVAGTVALATGARIRLGRRERRALPHERGPLALGAVAGMIALFFVLYKFTTEVSESDDSDAIFKEYEPKSGGGGPAIAIIAIVLIFAVLPADRVIMWILLPAVRRVRRDVRTVVHGAAPEVRGREDRRTARIHAAGTLRARHERAGQDRPVTVVVARPSAAPSSHGRPRRHLLDRADRPHRRRRSSDRLAGQGPFAQNRGR